MAMDGPMLSPLMNQSPLRGDENSTASAESGRRAASVSANVSLRAIVTSSKGERFNKPPAPGQRGSPRSHLAVDADDDAQDLRLAELRAAHVDGLHGGDLPQD